MAVKTHGNSKYDICMTYFISSSCVLCYGTDTVHICSVNSFTDLVHSQQSEFPIFCPVTDNITDTSTVMQLTISHTHLL